MHLTDNQYIEVITTKLQAMHDLKSNFDKFRYNFHAPKIAFFVNL